MKLAIIHSNPIELYPPVLNLINYLGENHEMEVEVYTTSGDFPPFRNSSTCIKIFRNGHFLNRPGFARYINYLRFYSATTAKLFSSRPDVVVYFETLSALPPVLYKRFGRRDAALFIHYHEYTSPEEYRSGMMLTRWFHRLEKKIYARATWISHTNQDRMDRFLADIGQPALNSARLLPNYPPSAWKTFPAGQFRTRNDRRLKIVYVGALSLKTMYTKEFAEWVIRQQGNVTWDIYSANTDGDVRAYLQKLDSPYICFQGGVDYFSLPEILSAYDVGVILYKGHIANYVYNAPNKLFEYMACGLDVWYPEIMKGCHPYDRIDAYPKVIPLDFPDLSNLDLSSAVRHDNLPQQLSVYYAESVLFDLIQTMKAINSYEKPGNTGKA